MDKETKKISKLDIVLASLIIASVHIMIAGAIAGAIAGLIALLFCN